MRIAVLLIAASLPACRASTTTPCACTEEFRTYQVTVIDDAGQPVADVQLTRTLVRTGAILEPGWLGMTVPGTYVVADDSQTDVYSGAGDTVRVTGAKGGATFAADFVFAVPEPCRCHVTLVSGPDTVIIGDRP